MNLGKILGSISPAFGMMSGKGLFGGGLMQQLGGMGLGGLLSMLLSKGGGKGEEGAAPPVPDLPQQQAPVDLGGMDQQSAAAIGNSMPMGGGQPPIQPRRFGRFGDDIYFGGRNPFGQNALGKLLGGLF